VPSGSKAAPWYARGRTNGGWSGGPRRGSQPMVRHMARVKVSRRLGARVAWGKHAGASERCAGRARTPRRRPARGAARTMSRRGHGAAPAGRSCHCIPVWTLKTPKTWIKCTKWLIGKLPISLPSTSFTKAVWCFSPWILHKLWTGDVDSWPSFSPISSQNLKC
jgi:hypothetical protein